MNDSILERELVLFILPLVSGFDQAIVSKLRTLTSLKKFFPSVPPKTTILEPRTNPAE
jgi:hypothetical protein